MGIRCIQLTTEEIIELFYKVYNPEIAEKERFTDVNNITSNVVANAKEKSLITDETENKSLVEQEAVIDNTSLVEEQKKKDTQLKDRAAMKDGEKQVAATPGIKPAPAQVATLATPVPAGTPANRPETAPVTAPGQPVPNISKPVNEKVGQTDNPAAASFGQTPPAGTQTPLNNQIEIK